LQQIAEALDRWAMSVRCCRLGAARNAWIVASLLCRERSGSSFWSRCGRFHDAGASGAMVSTLDRFSGGRLLINVVAGGDTERVGRRWRAARSRRAYDLTDEFLDVYRSLLQGERVQFEGEHVKCVGGNLTLAPPMQKPYPALYFGGSSPKAAWTLRQSMLMCISLG